MGKVKELDGLRGNVVKYLPVFTEYLKRHGSEVVRGVLDKGSHGGFKLRLPLNKKDRWQMIQMLDLQDKSTVVLPTPPTACRHDVDGACTRDEACKWMEAGKCRVSPKVREL